MDGVMGFVVGFAVWGIIALGFEIADYGASQECARIHQVECEQVWQPVSVSTD